MPDGAPLSTFRRLSGFVRRNAVLPVLAGLGLFTVAIASSLSQPLDCVQPDANGCPLELDQTVAAVMSGDVLIHRWRFQVPESPAGSGTASFSVTLPAPPMDYDLYVANADGRIVGGSFEAGPIVDEIVRVEGVAPGTYVAIVVSPRCEKSAIPYTLVASTRPAALAPRAGDPPTAPADVSILLGAGLGMCAGTPGPSQAVNPYGAAAAPAPTNPYADPASAPQPDFAVEIVTPDVAAPQPEPNITQSEAPAE